MSTTSYTAMSGQPSSGAAKAANDPFQLLKDQVNDKMHVIMSEYDRFKAALHETNTAINKEFPTLRKNIEANLTEVTGKLKQGNAIMDTFLYFQVLFDISRPV